MSDEACGHPKDDGKPCGTAFGLCPECGRCFTHCPHREQERTEARQRGAQRSNREPGTLPPGEVPPPPEKLEDAVLWAAWASHAVATGELGTTRANAAARLLKEFRQALERSEAKAELEDLRRRIEELSEENGGLEAVK